MMIKAFLVGGALCMLGQILIDRTRLTPARILSGYVVAVFTPVGIHFSISFNFAILSDGIFSFL